MIFDKLLEFDPTGTVLAVSVPSTNVIDLVGAGLIPSATSAVRPGIDIGGGGGGGAVPSIYVLVNTTFTAAGGATLNAAIQAAPDDGTNTNTPGAYSTYAETGAIALSNLVAGNVIWSIPLPRVLPLPTTQTSRPRFLRMNYTVASGPFTAGALQAHIVLAGEPSAYYPAGIAIAN